MATTQLRQEHEAAFRLQEPRSDVCVRVVQDTTKVDGLGGEVWAGALVLCEFLEAQAEALVHGRDVIELGAGCGLCGLVAASLGAKSVVLTDEYPDLLERNITKNRHLWAERKPTGASVIVSSGELEWGETAAMAPFVGKFDSMLGSEITQLGRDLHVPLLETIRAVLRPGLESVALLSMDPCRATCEGICDVRKCTASHFVAAAQQIGFSVHKHPAVRLASRATVTALVGALGRPLPIDEDDWSVSDVSIPIQPRKERTLSSLNLPFKILLVPMPPLVVIRSGCKHVEYQENRSAWHRGPRLELLSDSDSDDVAVDEDDTMFHHAETHGHDAGVVMSQTCGYGFRRDLREIGGMHAYRCVDCGNVVADRDDIVSKTFFGRTGKAFLMNNMYNVRVGPARNRYLMTGMHTIADVVCDQCDFVLGWKYAMESSQKYKEGKFIMEHAVVQDDSEEKAWNRL
ncbi:hypothetical protein BBJ28_00004903 [Nothophytophthora sp. Chile5]|nr:hypothetical protein BBJ28_00004903 [Nothophytophthora sp. Chile5]